LSRSSTSVGIIEVTYETSAGDPFVLTFCYNATFLFHDFDRGIAEAYWSETFVTVFILSLE
jgi:hypothetical protein